MLYVTLLYVTLLSPVLAFPAVLFLEWLERWTMASSADVHPSRG